MNNDLISREALKELILNLWNYDADYSIFKQIETLIDNAPTVAVNCKDCDGYEAGYSAGLKDEARPQGDTSPMELVMGKCPIEAGGNCPLRPQGERENKIKCYECFERSKETGTLLFCEATGKCKFDKGGKE